MLWFYTFIITALEKLITWFIGRGIVVGTTFLTYATFTVGLFTAFVAALFVLLETVRVAAPDGMSFILSLLPPSTSAMISVYFTALVLRRVYDYHKKLTRDFTQATLKF